MFKPIDVKVGVQIAGVDSSKEFFRGFFYESRGRNMSDYLGENSNLRLRFFTAAQGDDVGCLCQKQ